MRKGEGRSQHSEVQSGKPMAKRLSRKPDVYKTWLESLKVKQCGDICICIQVTTSLKKRKKTDANGMCVIIMVHNIRREKRV